MKVTGYTLIDLGYTPASWFGEAIQIANEKGLVGDGLITFLDTMAPIEVPTIEPHTVSVLSIKILKQKLQMKFLMLNLYLIL